MTDLEKVIKGLRCIAGDVVWCAQCPYSDVNGSGRGDRCKRECAKDTLAMLKAQQSRVMTLEEACSDIDFCWLEIKDYQAVWVSDCVIMPNGKQVLIERLGCDPVAFKPKDYGRTWRCWENKPTDDQMGAVKWE